MRSSTLSTLCSLLSVLALAACAPEQIRIALGSAPGTMQVAWNTEDGMLFNVSWGEAGAALAASSAGDSRAINCTDQLLRYTHMATLRGLKEGCAYDYRVGPAGKLWSFTFRTKHVEGRPDRHIIFGDMGASHAFSLCEACSASSSVCDATVCATNRTDLGLVGEVGRADMFLHVGDFAYNLGSSNGTTGDQFFRNIEQIAATTPYMVSHGNHEDGDSDLAQYLERFRHVSHPQNAVPPTYVAANGEVANTLYFSWDAGLVHYVALSTELWFGVKSGAVDTKAMLAWLEADLEKANANRANVPWIVVHGHRSVYCSIALSDDGDCIDIVGFGPAGKVRKDMEPLLHKYGVDFFVNGHEHSYERTYPVFKARSEKSNIDPSATVYIVTGAAGSPEMHEGFSKIAPTWSAFRSNSFGYTVFEAHNASHVHLQQIQTDPTLFPGADYGRVIDDAWYVQHNHGPFDARRAPTGTAWPRNDESPERSDDHWLPLLFPEELQRAKATGVAPRASSALIREYRNKHGDQAWARKQDALLKHVNDKQSANGRTEWEDVRGDGSSEGVWFTWKDTQTHSTKIHEL